MIDRRNLQAFHPFARLDRLLDPIAPGASPRDDGGPILLSVGEPQMPPPDMIAEEIAKHAHLWSRYPPARANPDYLEACAAWLRRRYGLPETVSAPGAWLDPDTAIQPLPGSREGLYFAVQSCVPLPDAGFAEGERPLVLVPNPFYHVYAGAAAAAGAEPVYVPATRDSGFLPDLTALSPDLLDRAAFCFYCTPSNPQGAAADLPRLIETIELARRHDFVVAFDECYADTYVEAPPPGAVQAALALDGRAKGNGQDGRGLDKVLVFHSLSKRSSAPGLRCGFAAGPAGLIASLDAILRVGGAGVPLPAVAAGTRLWRDEEHPVAIRARYRENFAIAERVLGNRFAFRKPDGGFFLWLEVGDGEAAAIRLWREAGIKVLPGGYMCADDGTGGNPGDAYIRVALVHDPVLTETALTRLAEVL